MRLFIKGVLGVGALIGAAAALYWKSVNSGSKQGFAYGMMVSNGIWERAMRHMQETRVDTIDISDILNELYAIHDHIEEHLNTEESGNKEAREIIITSVFGISDEAWAAMNPTARFQIAWDSMGDREVYENGLLWKALG